MDSAGFQWSPNALHIQSLFDAWKGEDGWDEASVSGVEQTLSVRFPPILRYYYLSWGKRPDYNRSNEGLLNPEETFERHGHLVFCIENQAVNFWGIPMDQLDKPDPPVNYIYNEETDIEWKPCYERLTVFLDALLYHHAFVVHGVSAQIPEERRNDIKSLVKAHYTQLQLDSTPWGIRRSEEFIRWTLYVAPGIAIDMTCMPLGLFVASRSTDAIQALENLIGFKCQKVW